jgi:hypothetical protein
MNFCLGSDPMGVGNLVLSGVSFDLFNVYPPITDTELSTWRFLKELLRELSLSALRW